MSKSKKSEGIARVIEAEKGLYALVMQPVERKAQKQVLVTTVDQQRIRHERLRHASLNKIEKTLRIINGIDLKTANGTQCGLCQVRSQRENRGLYLPMNREFLPSL